MNKLTQSLQRGTAALLLTATLGGLVSGCAPLMVGAAVGTGVTGSITCWTGRSAASGASGATATAVTPVPSSRAPSPAIRRRGWRCMVCTSSSKRCFIKK